MMAADRDARPVRHDVYIAILVFALAWTGCRLYLPAFRAAGGRGMSYYDEFAPAVMAACGRGFVNTPTRPVPALDAFLRERTGSFDCRELDRLSTTVPLDDFQGVTRNLLLAAAAVWRVTGISWTALDSLAAAMFGVTLAATYLALRFVMGRALALIGTLVWGISPMHLANAPHLRDYSKAPFFLLTMLAIVLAFRTDRPKALVVLGAVFGLVQGVGLGMRTDVVLNFVPFFVGLFAFGARGVTRQLAWKCAASVASLVVFVLAAWPVLAVYRHSEGLGHVSLLGLTTPFDSALNIRPALYDFGYLYDDSYVSTVVQAYWYRVHDVPQVSLHEVKMYELASREYYASLVSTFPADFLTRMAGSALHVLNLPFSISYGIVPLGIENAVLTWLASVRASVMVALAGIGPIAAACLLVLVGMRDRFAACVGFTLLLFWAAYPYLQFHSRHVFHLEILTIAVLLWMAHLTWRTIVVAHTQGAWRHAGKRALQSLALVAVLAAVVVVGIGTMRLVQTPRARALFAEYADAPEEPMDVRATAHGGLVSLSPALFQPAEPRFHIQQAMLVLHVSAGCGAADVPLHIGYVFDRSASADFSRDLTVRVDAGAGSSRVYVPVYSVESADGVSRFSSVAVPESVAACVRLSRARRVERLPLMLDVSLPQHWQEQPMYERLYLGPILPERVWLRVARWWPRVAAIG